MISSNLLKGILYKNSRSEIWFLKNINFFFFLINIALIHSKPIKLTEDLPPYDIIAKVKILGIQLHFTGSFSNGINSHDYGSYNRAFVIEDYKIVMNENDEVDLDKVCYYKFRVFTYQ